MWALGLATLVVAIAFAAVGAARRDLEAARRQPQCTAAHNHAPCCHGCRPASSP